MHSNQPRKVGPPGFFARIAAFLTITLPLAALVGLHTDDRNADWLAYGGNKAGNRYSPLTQINLSNVKQLKVAWEYDATKPAAGAPAPGIAAPRRPMEIQCQPIIVNGILYGTTPLLSLFALKADTGEELWRFDPFTEGTLRFHVSRGVMFWQDGRDKRVIYTAGNQLCAVDAATGKLVKSFGNGGKVDLREGVTGRPGRENDKLSVDATSPGVIYKDMLVIGSRVSEYGDAAPGHIRAFDVRTGKLKWTFHTVPEPGEPGHDTWPKDAWKRIGGANNWAGMVLDEKRGAVYFGTGSPSVDFYGADREGKNLYANCVISLNAETGKMNWYYQTVHHDLWDRDISCQPNLLTVTHKGPNGRSRKIDAVAQATKDGLLFLLDRDTGKPLFPVEERPALTDYHLPGEHPWPTQPFPTKPAPFARQSFTEAEITDRTPEAHAFVKKKFAQTRSGNKYMPPSREGSLYLGIGGGAEWGGNAADPQGILYQNSNEMVWDLKMMDYNGPAAGGSRQAANSPGQLVYMRNCAACHRADRQGSGQEYPSLVQVSNRMSKEEISNIVKTGRGRMPAFQHISDQERNELVAFLTNAEQKASVAENHSASEAPVEAKSAFPYIPPYINNGWTRFFDPDGYPAIKPPWGTLNAIDLNTGEYLWRVPLGEFPELTQKGIPVTGTENYGGPIVTAGGLVFIAGTKDEKIRAFDRKSGKTVWEYQLPAGGFATPATYMVNGKQYVVIAAGGAKNGHKPGGKYIAFALP
ncbi:PQQ-binding-like beta-propeller repeat protein [Dyadobacter sp. CY261]|uniref:outer membrane protein assembly factor BamB family protein n=1 Tax=Dyadobacter sp. CY261 TaxID=2907203 RepID=UPI001F2FFF6B|nr:PQQ-binding-like beta-propeller repeat protein [Dyadobacter sp. CY261]MCF0074411.1 PQQ-binding-like beta-propeller repeat protein [Dyadobacter sp. CY261]